MWDLLLDDEQTMIAETVRDYLAAEQPLERLRPNAPPRDLAGDRASMAGLGWLGVGLPEAVGGSGLGLVEEMLVARECGRFIVSPSVLATVVAAHIALHAGDGAMAAELVAGRTAAALAIPSGDRQAYAFDWSPADMLLLWSEDGIGLFDPAAFAGAVSDTCLDDSVTMHSGKLDLADARQWAGEDAAPLRRRAEVLLAANLFGLAEQACTVTSEYAKVREQFGKPIGAFQAVKHRCADMAVAYHMGWYQTSLACLKVAADAPDAALQVAAAKLYTAHAAHENCRAAIQMHGAIGYQAECDAHWFMKRAHLYDQTGGNMALQARRVVSAPSPLW
jgi:alkylation response protein AidB-like acyl-CoA dehydrogenase